MKHLSEGTLRRMLDEPDEVSEEDREHLETCEECKLVNGNIMQDVEALTAMFGPEPEDVDVEAAFSKLEVGQPQATLFATPAKPKKTKSKRSVPREPVTGGSQSLLFVGRVFVSIGTLVTLFVAYQLLGTNLITSREQKDLAAAMETQWTSNSVDDVPDLGEGVARIMIPKIGVDKVVVEGVEVADLKKGPGHWPGTAMPGQKGNMVISGHRTTYGAPFNRIDELEPGDPIVVQSREGARQYRVAETKIVLPSAVEVAAPTNDARLTLTACHPKFSAAQRIVVVAMLEGTSYGIAPDLLDQRTGPVLIPDS